MVVLPGDVLLMILDLLKIEGHNHNTIYQCALASRWLAEPALSILYQIYDTSPVAGGGIEDEQFKTKKNAIHPASSKDTQSPIIQKWALMWRSLILSTWEGKTYLPYCEYIRYLDLDDLRELMSDLGTKAAHEQFSTGDLGELIYREGHTGFRTSKGSLNVSAVVERIGTLVTEKAPMIKELRGTFSARALKTWATHLPHLQTLDVWHGASIGENSEEDIREHFPSLKNITVFRWTNEGTSNADSEAERVLKGLHPNSLQSFNVMSLSQLGRRSILALGCHLKSLTTLTLTSLSWEAIEQLPSLGALETLQELVLMDSRLHYPLSTALPDLSSSVAGWISQCEKLRLLRLRHFIYDDATLLSQILVDERIKLESLHLKALVEIGRPFHEALVSQPSLRVLSIHGECAHDILDQPILAQALSELSELRELDLRQISDGFAVEHITTLTPCLPKLERFSFTGMYFQDDIWPPLLALKNLRFLAIHAPCDFTAQGILDFVSQLGPQNEGFHLSIPNAVVEISSDAQEVIRDALAQNVKGSFDYDLIPEETDSEEGNWGEDYGQ